MAGRRLHFKPSQADTLRANQKAMDHLRAMSPREDAPYFDCGAKAKVERGPVNVDASEGPVQAAITQLLARHPDVWIALRMNGGMAYSESGAPVWFHRMLKCAHEIPRDCVMTDFWGCLIDKRPLAIEAKRPDWKGVSRGSGKTAIREQGQERFIECVRKCGGVGGFARSVDEALAIVEGKA